MKQKLLFFVLFLAVSANSYAQFTFQKGYFINNNNQKTECLIYDIDWKNNPTNFDYKVNETAEIQSENIENVLEFGLVDGVKYQRATVEIDRSSDDVKKMGKQRNPSFKEETVFLKTMINGKAYLYYYRDGSLKRYFVQKDSSPITQLVYKRYQTEAGGLATNTYFKQQLLSDFQCSSISQKDVESLEYELKDLQKFILKFNECQNSTSQTFKSKQKRDLFNLAIRPGVDFNSLNVYLPKNDRRNVDFGKQTNFRVGLEAEYIIPYHNNKWSIVLEPTYQSYSSEKTYEASGINDGILTAKIDYSSIELPIGIRHTFFIAESSKIFLNAQYVLNLDLSPSLNYYRSDGTDFDQLDMNSGKNFAFGAGFKFQEKYIIEFRYQTDRFVLENYPTWSADYKTMSVIIGYNFM